MDERRPDDETTAAEAGRTDLDVPEPTQGYGHLAGIEDEELGEAYREAEPDPSRPVPDAPR